MIILPREVSERMVSLSLLAGRASVPPVAVLRHSTVCIGLTFVILTQGRLGTTAAKTTRAQRQPVNRLPVQRLPALWNRTACSRLHTDRPQRRRRNKVLSGERPTSGWLLRYQEVDVARRALG
eukprot:COSAG02_NODE_4931_length_4820_cov_2.612794_1_plen_123_part_00